MIIQLKSIKFFEKNYRKSSHLYSSFRADWYITNSLVLDALIPSPLTIERQNINMYLNHKITPLTIQKHIDAPLNFSHHFIPHCGEA